MPTALQGLFHMGLRDTQYAVQHVDYWRYNCILSYEIGDEHQANWPKTFDDRLSRLSKFVGNIEKLGYFDGFIAPHR
jgi:hypothetical protein